MSLQKKLIIIFGTLIFSILLVYNISAYIMNKDVVVSMLKKELSRTVEGMEHLVEYYDKISKNEENIVKLKESIKSIKIGESGYAYFVDSDGEVLIHPSLEGTSLKEAKDINGFQFMKEILAKKNGETVYFWANKNDPKQIDEKIVVYTYYEPLDWYMIAGITLEEFLAPVEKTRNMLITLGLIFLAVGLVIVMIVGRSIAKPVMNIAKTLRVE